MILGLNLAVPPFSIALYENETLCKAIQVTSGYEFSENIMIEIDRLITEVGKVKTDLSAIGVVHGPGQYTGLRISVTTVKTIAQCLDIPVYGIDTLEAFVHQYGAEGLCFAVIPAIKGQVNIALFSINPQGIRRLSDTMSVTYDKCEAMLLKTTGPVTVVGQIPDGLRSLMTSIPAVRCHETALSATILASLARRYLTEKKVGDYTRLLPHYSHDPIRGVGKKKTRNQ